MLQRSKIFFTKFLHALFLSTVSHSAETLPPQKCSHCNQHVKVFYSAGTFPVSAPAAS